MQENIGASYNMNIFWDVMAYQNGAIALNVYKNIGYLAHLL